jgi:hypothetical protein
MNDVPAAVVLPDERRCEGADLAEDLLVLNGTEPGHCIAEGDGGVARTLPCSGPGWIGRRRRSCAQRADDQRRSSIVKPSEALAEGASKGIGEGESGVGLKLFGLGVDLEP